MPTPKFPEYPKNSLRPNPQTADPTRGDLAFAQETISVGDFGSWDADANVVHPNPPAPRARGKEKPANLPEEVRPHRDIRAPKK